MTKQEIVSAKALLRGTNISILDAARLVRNILDSLPKSSKFQSSKLEFCSKIIDCGKRNFRLSEMRLKDGFALFLKSKAHLRKDSFRDIRYLGTRLLKSKPEFALRTFSELRVCDCLEWLSLEFKTPSQFNKARSFLHALFEFALKRDFCDKNPIKAIEKKKVFEREIRPLSYLQTKRLIANSSLPQNRDCLPAVGLLMLAGIRPREVRRLTWSDIDLQENSICIRSQCSKTGGVRQVEICSSLKRILKNHIKTCGEDILKTSQRICPPNWKKKWKNIREQSGFKGAWVQDVLRHTYASYHAKYFKNLHLLQLNMGHSSQALLRSRYVNMQGFYSDDARNFSTDN